MNIAVIMAAGRGERFGADDKLFALLAGRPVLEHSLQAFGSAAEIDRIILVTRSDRIDYCRTELLAGIDFAGRVTVVAGGEERQKSVWRGLEACPAAGTGLVWIHDGARPLVSAEEIDASARRLDKLDGLIFASPIADTLKQVEEGIIVNTWPRERFWRAETPQLFTMAMLRQAHRDAAAQGFIGTDDAALVERAGGRVGIFPTAGRNVKITTQADLAVAEQLMGTSLW